MQKFKSEKVSLAGIFLSYLVLFTVVYAAVIHSGYYFLDDYEYFTPPAGRSLEQFMNEAIREGRITEGFFLYVISANIESSESTKIIRFIGIIGIALFASVTYALFRQSRFRYDHAFLMSALICMLPPFQLLASWMIIVPSIYSVTSASLSALLISRTAFKEDNERTNSAVMFISAIVLLIVALSINQPPAMMYWAMGIIFLIAGENYNLTKKEFRLMIIKYFAVGLTSTLIYYLVFIKTIPSFMNITGRGILVDVQHITTKLKWFLLLPFKNAVNLWNIYPTYKFGFIIIAIILIGVMISILQKIKENKTFFSDYFQKYSIALCLVMLSYLPNMLVTENEPGYRTLISLSTALSLLFFWGLVNIVEFLNVVTNFSAKSRQTILSVVLIILTIFTASSAHSNVNKFAALYSSELIHMKNSITDYGVSNLLRSSKIYIRRSHIQSREGELGLKPNSASHCGQILRIIKQALLEVGVKGNIQITHGADDEPIPQDKDILIIDMAKM